ncbi:MAG: ribosomal-protein-alanine N-acetyltransferase [Alphaproteobacteria bacterium]|nr:ribosomal-protein-alanine N-acetyltransferase [Alphaproteobacteria bacterium]
MAVEISIEIAGPAHAAVLARLSGEAFGPGGWSESQMQAGLDAPGTAGFIATSRGSPVGFALWRTVIDDAELLTIGVNPAHRRQGVAAALLESVLAAAAAAQCRRLFLEVAVDNAGAIALYRDRAFREIDRRRRYYRDGRDALVMARQLMQQ